MSENTLPQLVLEVSGQVVSTNLDAFKASARNFIDGINTDLQTDDDFIAAESAVKVCKETEDRIDAAKSAAISRMATVDDLFRVVDEIKEEIRAKRLVLERTVNNRKEMVRTEIVEEAYKGLLDHCERTFESTGFRMGVIRTPLIEAMRGKKTVRTCREAVDQACSVIKENITLFSTNLSINRKSLVSEDGLDNIFLFPDFDDVGMQDPPIFKRIAEERIDQHTAAQQAAEEQRKAREEAARKAREEAQARELVQDEARRIAEAEASAQQSRLMQAEESLMRRAEAERAQKVKDALDSIPVYQSKEPEKAPESPVMAQTQAEPISAHWSVVDAFIAARGIDQELKPLLEDFVCFYQQASF